MTPRQRRRHRSAHGGSVGKKVLLALGVVFACVGIAIAGGVIWVLDVAAKAPDIDTLKPADSGANTQIFAADGSSLGYVQSDIVRTPVSLDKIPKRLQSATIAIEDEHFYDHGGVDYGAIVRAALENFQAGEVKQGASTITQQLVRNLYITDPKDTIQRKIIEAKMAMQFEDEHSKPYILNDYLNTAAYGTNDGKTSIGVQAAAEVFFNKNVSDLNLNESALLAGLPQAPTDYNPFTNPEGAKRRRNEVLKAMADQGYISQSQYLQSSQDGLGLHRGYQYEQRSQQFFFDFVQEELIDKYGVATVRDGGLKVYTTLDPALQALAEQSIAAHPVYGAAEALVSTNADTGEIKAMASSQSYDDSQFNLAAQGRRQPGSSFKTFALTEAVNEGIDPDTTYYSAPASIVVYPPGGAPPWPVVGDGTGGTMSLRDALAHSVNTVFAQLVLDITPQAMDEMAHKLGITTPLYGYPSEVLGTTDVTVLEMADAYATIANGGVHHDATAVDRVVFPDGHVDEPEKPEGNRVISDGVAYTVADVMKGTLEFGTAAGQGIQCPSAGKTGTTEAQADAWFVGYTPHVSTAVWVGNPDSRQPMPGYGADLAAPIWHDYMAVAAAQPCDDFPQPQNPAELSSYSSSYTASSSSDSSTGTTTAPDGTATTPTTTTPDTGTGGGPNGYDPNLYAPGAGQDPAPTPAAPPAGGGGSTGGGSTDGGVIP